MIKRIPILLALLGAGCSYVPMLGLSPHRVDIQQGNYVTQEMVAKLEPGMTKNQVRFALGTPLITDPFHPDRWDYVFVQQRQGQVTQKRRVVVVFENDRLARIEGEVAPARDIAQETVK
ncbi:MAG TPA: outer membrane protein assembly factor BamE [Burkholderiales bacterium]|nr:outer membrane protein assembly factor BamE [Burkholderiales bacterium]